MYTLKASTARIPTEAFNRVVYNGERIRIQHRSAGSVVLVSEEDAKLLEDLENRRDAEDADRAMRDYLASGKPAIPWEQAKADLGLD